MIYPTVISGVVIGPTLTGGTLTRGGSGGRGVGVGVGIGVVAGGVAGRGLPPGLWGFGEFPLGGALGGGEVWTTLWCRGGDGRGTGAKGTAVTLCDLVICTEEDSWELSCRRPASFTTLEAFGMVRMILRTSGPPLSVVICVEHEPGGRLG